MTDSLLAQLDFITLLPFAAFGAIAIAAWVVADMLLNNTSRSDKRLEQMKNRALGRATGNSSVTQGSSGSKDGFKRLLEAASPTLGDTLKPKSEREISKQREKLDSAGFRSENAPAMLNSLKLILAITGFVIGGGTNMLVFGLTINSLIYTIICTGVFMFIPEVILGLISKSRKEKVFLGLPDALDLMVVCVEAGLGLDQAMRKVSEELSQAHPVIAEEFDICNKQLQMGRKRDAVLTDLGDRNGVDDLKTLASIMIQVDRFGTSIGTALRTQSDTMRVRRRQIAEEKAAKTAVKLIFPLVLFIFPGIFVVLVGPAAITMVNEMLPALQK